MLSCVTKEEFVDFTIQIIEKSMGQLIDFGISAGSKQINKQINKQTNKLTNKQTKYLLTLQSRSSRTPWVSSFILDLCSKQTKKQMNKKQTSKQINKQTSKQRTAAKANQQINNCN